VPAELAARYRAEGLWTDATLGELVAASVARNPGNAMRVYSDARPWSGTFADVDRAARGLAGSLRAEGVGAGDVVVMQLPNWAEAAVTFWASAYLGAVIVPVVHFYGAKEVDYILRAMRPDVVVTADRFRRADYLATYEALLAAQSSWPPPATGGSAPSSRSHRATAGCRWLVVGDTPASALPAGARPLDRLTGGEPVTAPATVDPDAPAVAAFTSGTTSDPKGALHSHRTLGAEMSQMSARTAGGPPMLTGAPIGHFAGMLGAFLRPLIANAPIHLVDVWDPATVLRLMLSERLSMGGGATYFLTSLLDHPDFTEEHQRLMPVCGLGGSAVPLAVTTRATRLGITVFRSYGCTEHPSVTAGSFTDPEAKRLGTDGRPLAGVELRLDDEGQIHTRGPDLFLGYTDPALTASVFDADGWYRTGDVGRLDDEGYLTITDRVSDVIIRGGENISAQEIEELFLTIDGVLEVAVVAEPDDRLGEHAAAVFTMRPGVAPPTPERVRAHLGAAGLARQKWPEALYHVREFPRTASGKVRKVQLRRQLRGAALEHLASWHE
jgi:acyl-CoA synthetase (AMP-forming)/AMP-acid ligase II